MAGAEKKFSLGWFEDDYLKDCEIAVVYNEQNNAIAFTGLNYFLLTGYDTLAVRYLGQTLSYRRIALVSLISYAISNSVGLALLSGSAIRYKFYSAWGFSAAKIALIITFCNLL
jgi:uncharacterized membrane protein YbhN (UPF0104 family)